MSVIGRPLKHLRVARIRSPVTRTWRVSPRTPNPTSYAAAIVEISPRRVAGSVTALCTLWHFVRGVALGPSNGARGETTAKIAKEGTENNLFLFATWKLVWRAPLSFSGFGSNFSLICIRAALSSVSTNQFRKCAVNAKGPNVNPILAVGYSGGAAHCFVDLFFARAPYILALPYSCHLLYTF